MRGYSIRRFQSAQSDVWKLAQEHVPGAIVAFIVSILVFPLSTWGESVTHEAWKLFVDGVLGPIGLYVIVFGFYWIRYPAKMDAQRIAEIRTLRIAQGLSVADLAPTKRQSPFAEYFFRVFAGFMIFAIIGAVVSDYYEAKGIMATSRMITTIDTRVKSAMVSLKRLGEQQDAYVAAIKILCGPRSHQYSDACKKLDDRLWAIRLKYPPAAHPPSPAQPVPPKGK